MVWRLIDSHRRRSAVALLAGIATAWMAVTGAGMPTGPQESVRAAAGGSGQQQLVGTWFEPWYNRTTTYDWATGGPGKESSVQLVGDATGDGRDDAVVAHDDSWWIAASDGSHFETYVHALTGVARGQTFLADVNGDGLADLISCHDGLWTVATSDGSSFSAPRRWTENLGASSTIQFAADVNGDGMADAIVYANGRWTVAISTGSGFGQPRLWGMFGNDSTTQLVADVTGDGRADAVAVAPVSGTWSVATNSGGKLGGGSTWLSDFDPGSAHKPLLGDVTGDGVADAVSYQPDGVWYVSPSSGGGFADPHKLQPYRSGFGGNTPVDVPFGKGATDVFVGNVYGADDPTMSLIAFDRDTGHWQVKGVNNYKFKNRWESWSINYVPEASPGEFRQYDSGDPSVIDFQLAQLTQAGIDFVIFDETNFLHADDNTILRRNQAIVRGIARWNDNPDHRRIRNAIAVGGINYTNDPQTFEQEAGEVWELFTNDPDVGGPENYMYINDKPLIVLYTSLEMREKWESSDVDKTNSNRFTLRYAEGPLRQGYYGWFNPPSGPIANDEVMFVTPRKAANINDVSSWFGRSLDYYAESWRTAIKKDPDVIIAGAYNDYLENNWIAPTDQSRLPADMKKYQDQNEGRYDAWNMTKRYILEYRVSASMIRSTVDYYVATRDINTSYAHQLEQTLRAAGWAWDAQRPRVALRHLQTFYHQLGLPQTPGHHMSDEAGAALRSQGRALSGRWRLLQ